MPKDRPRTLAGKVWAKEQRRLALLPHVEIDVEDRDYYSSPAVFAACHYSGKDATSTESGWADRRTLSWSCGYCHLAVEGQGPLPRHSRILGREDEMRERIGSVAEMLGMNYWDDSVSRAMYVARHGESRATTVQGMMAEALPVLTAALHKQEAAAGLTKALDDLDGYQSESDEHPFFTEATLYELLGKDEARTVLAYMGNLRRAAGR